MTQIRCICPEVPKNLGDKILMKYKFKPDTEGGLLISSKQWLNSFSDAVGYRLSVLLDVDGQTELTCDYPNQSWDDVWQQEANYFLNLCQLGVATIIVFKKGLYEVHINLNQPLQTESIYVSNLIIEDNNILVAEAGDFLETYFSEENYEFQELILPSGFYEVYCTVKNTEPEKILNICFKQVKHLSTTSIREIICV